MAIQNGEIGDLVLIEKQGQERSKYGKTFNRFQFVVNSQNKSNIPLAIGGRDVSAVFTIVEGFALKIQAI